MENKDNAVLLAAVTTEAVQVLVLAALGNLVRLSKEQGHKTRNVAVFVDMEYTYFLKAIKGDVPFPLVKFVRFCFLVGVNPFLGLVGGDLGVVDDAVVAENV